DVRSPSFARQPRTVEIGRKPWTDRLDEQSARSISDRHETFYAQNVVSGNRSGDPTFEMTSVDDFAKLHNEAFEIVMVMLSLALQFVMGKAVAEIGFGGGAEPEQGAHIDVAIACANEARAGPHARFEF